MCTGATGFEAAIDVASGGAADVSFDPPDVDPTDVGTTQPGGGFGATPTPSVHVAQVAQDEADRAGAMSALPDDLQNAPVADQLAFASNMARPVETPSSPEPDVNQFEVERDNPNETPPRKSAAASAEEAQRAAATNEPVEDILAGVIQEFAGSEQTVQDIFSELGIGTPIVAPTATPRAANQTGNRGRELARLMALGLLDGLRTNTTATATATATATGSVSRHAQPAANRSSLGFRYAYFYRSPQPFMDRIPHDPLRPDYGNYGLLPYLPLNPYPGSETLQDWATGAEAVGHAVTPGEIFGTFSGFGGSKMDGFLRAQEDSLSGVHQ